MTSNKIDSIVPLIQKYRPAELLSMVGSLQLMPENADHTVRLEALAHAAASLRGGWCKRPVTRDQLHAIVASQPLLGINEIPFNNPFTEAFTFFGGSFLVFPGAVDDVTFVLSHLMDALFMRRPSVPDMAFLRNARAVISAVLTMSDEMVHRAGLDRGVEPNSTLGSGVVVPDSKRLANIRRSVIFGKDDLSRLLATRQTTPAAIEALTASLGHLRPADYDSAAGPLLARPIVQTRNGLIVAIPGILLHAAVQELIHLAHQAGMADEIAHRFNAAVWDTVVESLGFLIDSTRLLRLPPTSSIPGSRDALFALDSDKLVYALLVTDALIPGTAPWPNSSVGAAIERRLRAVEEYAFRLDNAPNELLFLVLIQGVAQPAPHPIEVPVDAPNELLTLSAGDLRTITLLEIGNPLALRQYAHARRRIREHAQVIARSTLDEYAFYREHGHSYYLTDDATPDLLSILGGGAGQLRRETLQQRDWHAVPSPTRGHYIEVVSLHNTRDVPLYVPLSSLRGQVALFVEGLPLPIWILGPEGEDNQVNDLRETYAQFADGIGYWLWQCTPSLTAPMQSIPSSYSPLRMILRLEPAEEWRRTDLVGNGADQPHVAVSVTTEGDLTVTLRPTIRLLLQGPDNAGEREMMRYILAGLREVLPMNQRDLFSEDEIASLLDRHAPLGLKRKVFFLQTSNAPQLDPRDLPSYRLVQEAEENELLDQLGQHLSGVGGFKIGAIPKGDRTRALNEAVSFLFREFTNLVRTLSSDGLLEWLVGYQEALIRQVALRHLTVPTELACFSTQTHMVDQLHEEIPKYTRAGIASRFVLEYVTACPPAGIRPMSLSVYDRLQALASLIATFGVESDLFKFQLIDEDIALLPSGRLGIEQQTYTKAIENYFSAFGISEIGRLTRIHGRQMMPVEPLPDKPPLAARLDAASEAEFGASLTDLWAITGEAIVLAQQTSPAVIALPVDELTERLATALGWEESRVKRALEVLSLGPRESFLVPPPPFEKTDVYPWRFNRLLSYLRRPFLRRYRDEITEIVYGPRNLHISIRQLTALCLNGRLQATSAEKRKIMGELVHQIGEKFNDDVADLLATNSGLVVRRRVKKIGKLKELKTHLGDIDVLAADCRRHILWVIECKDFSVARMPHELDNELKNLLVGQESKMSAVAKTQQRTEWIRAHLPDVLNWLGLPNAICDEAWAVESLIVVDQELFSPYLQESSISVVSLAQLDRQLDLSNEDTEHETG